MALERPQRAMRTSQEGRTSILRGVARECESQRAVRREQATSHCKADVFEFSNV